VPRPWSSLEIDTLVADYFDMLALELRGEPFNKAARNRGLQKLIGRSHGSIEMKHQNVSAVLRDINSRYIDGYKPLGNYQDALYDAVTDRVSGDDRLEKALAVAADSPPPAPSIEDILERLVSAPRGEPRAKGLIAERRQRASAGPKVDYVAREARNSALGARGEAWVLAFERARLIKAGKASLADRVEQVSETVGPSSGFDIHSYERNGSDRFIEVKTTKGPIGVAFFVSANEVRSSIANEERYHLYRPFKFDRDPHLFIVQGRLDRTCRLDAEQFRAQVA
jgi:hypothetical protein